MNPRLAQLHAYPFERLKQALEGVQPPAHKAPIRLSIGEPQHATPAFIREALIAHLDGLARYPATRGEAALRAAIAHWLCRRFALPAGSVDPDRQILPVNGTREALFAFAQALIRADRPGSVLLPNPGYQIYEGAALLAGAKPWYVAVDTATGVPDYDAVPAAVWQDCELLYLCSPDNPGGAVHAPGLLQRLLELADAHDFIIAADECYSEIYYDETNPPPGLLGVAATLGRSDFRRCVVFHSLSKRSSVPGLRSGFVAGDAAVLDAFFRYRTYHGCAMPPPVQAASIAAWSDEAHVRENRAQYRAKFDAVLPLLRPHGSMQPPQGGFYLWPRLGPDGDADDVAFACRLYAEQNVLVLPGSLLGRTVHGSNPGCGRVRIALVPPLAVCIDAAQRIAQTLASPANLACPVSTHG